MAIESYFQFNDDDKIKYGYLHNHPKTNTARNLICCVKDNRHTPSRTYLTNIVYVQYFQSTLHDDDCDDDDDNGGGCCCCWWWWWCWCWCWWWRWRWRRRWRWRWRWWITIVLTNSNTYIATIIWLPEPVYLLCIKMTIYYSGDHLTDNFYLAIQIRLKRLFMVITLLFIRLIEFVAHVTTPQMLFMLNFASTRSLEFGIEQTDMQLESLLRWKII